MFGEAVVVDAGDLGALGGVGGFLFDDGGEGDEAVRVRGEAERLRLLLEAVDHDGGHVVHAHDAGELVGVGEEIAFERVGLRVDGADQRSVMSGFGDEVFFFAEARAFDGGSDFEDVVAFGDDDGADDGVAARDAVEDLELLAARTKRYSPALSVFVGMA